MRIGFYLKRGTYLKTLGALIDLCVQRGNQVLLACEIKSNLGDKSYLNLDRTKLRHFINLGCEFLAVESVSDLRTKSLDALVTLEGFHTLKGQIDKIEALRSMGTKVVSLTHFFEITKRPLEALDKFDKTYYLSEYARDLHFGLNAKAAEIEQTKQEYQHKFEVVGSPAFDQIGNISKDKAREELGIPPNKKVVLLMAPVISPITPWRFHVWDQGSRLQKTRAALAARRINFIPDIWLHKPFPDIMRGIREFCDREDAWLVIKSRGKQNDPRYMREVADLYFAGMEDDYYPVFTTYKLLAAADLCITVNSMAAIEAAAAGVPCLNIYVPHLDKAFPWTQEQIAYQTRLLGGAPGSLMNYSGVISKVSWKTAPSYFSRKKLGAFSSEPDMGAAYAKKYLGIERRSSSERIAYSLEQLAAAG